MQQSMVLELLDKKFTQYTQVERDLLPLERVEIDHTILDVIVVDPCDRLPLGRPTITVALDVGTRYPVGFYMGFEPPSYLCVLECLNHAIRPKVDTREKYGTEHPWIAYGVPKCIVVDNGKEFVGRDLDDACRLLGIEMFRTPVAEPHYKGTIERLFRTLNTLIIQKIPGTTFSNPTERGDYDSLKRAVVTLDELESIVYIALLDIYAQRFHRRINDYPARCWERATKAGFSPSLPANIDELSIALGRVTDRTVQHYGIEFEGLVYNGKELSSLRASLSKGERVTVKYHPADISYIYVQDPFSKRYIKLSTALQKYVQGGLSLWRHRAQRKAVLQEQEAIDIQGLARAERKIAAKITDSTRKARLVTRSLKARWEGGRSAANQTAGAGEIAHTNVTETPEFEEPPVGACTTENYYSAGDKPVGDKDEIRFDLPRTDRKKGAVDARKEETGSVQEG